ncbi:hypothetical protein M406DRAFT_322639, partial [Cryphonectria parasitica EP155]
MSPLTPDSTKVALYRSHQHEHEAELARIEAEHAYRRQQAAETFQARKEAAIRKIDRLEAEELENIQRAHEGEVGAAKNRHEAKMETVRDKYEIGDEVVAAAVAQAAEASDGVQSDVGGNSPVETVRDSFAGPRTPAGRGGGVMIAILFWGSLK